MSSRVIINNLNVDSELAHFIESEALPGTGLSNDHFWNAFGAILSEMRPRNLELLEERDRLQRELDVWHQARRGQQHDVEEYRQFLQDIGYLAPEGTDFVVETENVDDEIAKLSGPQLVVPVSNARFALNAVNARWGSLFDALYGTDVLSPTSEAPRSREIDPIREAAVRRSASDFLDLAIPLSGSRHRDVVGYELCGSGAGFLARLEDGSAAALSDPNQFVGHRECNRGRCLLFRHNGLHIELVTNFEDAHHIQLKNGLRDVRLEAALTTIQDCEDSVAAVDSSDKVQVYRNWLGLMRGNLSVHVEKSGVSEVRRIASDKRYTDRNGRPVVACARSLMLVRNVGLLMTTDAVLDADGKEAPEGFLDAMVTATCALHDFSRNPLERNSKKGSIYIVKPKLHGPEEARFTDALFSRVEDALALQRNTIKIGLMDEERRTSVNLKECIRAVKKRVVFINTGFLDRTGDEIHSCMGLGPVLSKSMMRDARWLTAYEDNNVDVGLAAGMQHRAQIGKGMWAQPDSMARMMKEKISHPLAGATTAWVPSPTAAVLHALHYHYVDVPSRQAKLRNRDKVKLNDLLTPPVFGDPKAVQIDVTRELDSNCQSILGYVARWVNSGIGCSKVPDIDNIPLMEDRATLRISSQLLANWLIHSICTRRDVEESMDRMARVVDRQNAGNPTYVPLLSDTGESFAFKAASELVFNGAVQPNGYTEVVLWKYRRLFKKNVLMEAAE